MMLFRYITFLIIFLFSLDLLALKEGDMAPDFSLQNIDGKSISLKEVSQQRYVIVHFWTPSNVKSREKHKFYSKLLDEYKKVKLGSAEGFEVITICLEEKREAWEIAVMKDGMNGLENVWDKNGMASLVAKNTNLNLCLLIFLLALMGK